MRADIFKDVTNSRHQALWLILAFQSGFMNAGGFLGVKRFVSHMTGYGTNVAISLGSKEYLVAFETALAPIFFLAGAIYAGWLVDRRLLQGREPRLLTGLLVMALINLAIYLAEFSGILGPFGEPLSLQHDVPLLFGLCFACGLQNGLFTSVTGGQVRTTHLTGPTTDLGLNISKIYTHPRDHPERIRLAAWNWLRAKIILAFSSGSLIAAMVFTLVDFEGFAVPCALSFFLIWYVRMLMGGAEADPRKHERVAAPDAGFERDGPASVLDSANEPVLD